MTYEEEKLGHELDKALDDLHGLNEDYGKLIDKLCAAEARADEAEWKLDQANKMLLFAARVVVDWLSGHSGNADFEERFFYAMGIKPLEWMREWDEEYVRKHEYCFKDWIERTKKELGIKNVPETP